MALKDVVYLRLKKLTESVRQKGPLELKSSSKLGELPIGFDSVVIKGQFLDALHSRPLGFQDFLKKSIPKSKVDTDTTLGDLTTLITEHSVYKNITEYEGAMKDRMRLALRKVLHEMANMSEDDISPDEAISTYVDNGRLGEFRQRIEQEAGKYLLGPITNSDIAKTVRIAQGRLAALCTA